MSATYIHFIQLVGWLNNNNKNDTRESFEMIRECVYLMSWCVQLHRFENKNLQKKQQKRQKKYAKLAIANNSHRNDAKICDTYNN